MRIFLILILISSASSSQKLTKSKQDQLLSTAISDVAKELFTRHELQFEILIYGKISPHVQDILNGFRREPFHTFIRNVSRISDWKIEDDLSNRFSKHRWLTNSAVIFGQSIENVRKMLDSHVGNANFPRNFKFLFYLEEPFDDTKIGVLKPDSGICRMNWFSYFIFKYKSKFEIYLKMLKI